MKKIALVATTALMALALAGCACSSPPSPDGGSAATGRAAQVDAAPESQGAEQAEAPGEQSGSDAAGGASAGDPSSSPATSSGYYAASSHVHAWTPVVEHHDAVYEQQWIDNYIWIERYKCKTCGAYTYSISEANAHQEASGRGGCGAYVSDQYQENRGYYEQVCVQDAYDEVVGYSCSCGATK